MKHTPATPLPWESDGSEMTTATWVSNAFAKRVCTMKPGETDWQDCQYIAHAANAYPRLVAELKKSASRSEDALRILQAQHIKLSPGYQYDLEMLCEQAKLARALLREIGEE